MNKKVRYQQQLFFLQTLKRKLWNLVFTTNSYFLIQINLQPNVKDLRVFKLWILFYQKVLAIRWQENFSLWQKKIISFWNVISLFYIYTLGGGIIPIEDIEASGIGWFTLTNWLGGVYPAWGGGYELVNPFSKLTPGPSPVGSIELVNSFSKLT